MEIKKFVRVLSVGAILGGLVSAGVPVNAKAEINGYTIKVENEIYVYDKYEVMRDFLNYKRGNTAKLYNEFSDKLKKGNGFYAFKDSKKGYIDYGTIKKEFLKTKHENKVFNIEEFTQSKESKVIEISWTKKAVITKDGQIKYETSLKNDLDNKNNDDANKENNKNTENKEDNKEKGNNSTDSKVVVNNDNKTSENSTSSNHRHKHNSSSVVKENEEEKKSDVVQKDDKKDKEDKKKQDQLKKEQEEKIKAEQAEKEKQAKIVAEKEKAEQQQKEAEAKAKAEAEKQKKSEVNKKEAQEKEKQEELKKEQEEKIKAEQAEKEKQAKMEAEKEKAEQQQKEAEARAKAEKVKQEQKAREEAERIEKEKQAEAEKQKEAEANQKEAQEKAKQEQLKKEQEEKIKAEQAEKEKQAKMEAEKKKAEQQQKEAEARAKAEKVKQEQKAREEAERIEKENNKLIEEAKNNINLGNLTDIKSNLILPTKDANGVQITWKSSDESVIKNDGTVTIPSADKGDKKVTLIATFTKDTLTSTKNFEAIVKAEEKIENNPTKDTMDKEISINSLKKDSEGNYIANNPEEFYCVVKDGLSKLQTSVVINLPNYKFGPTDSSGRSTSDPQYKLDVINEILVKYAEMDYGKPRSQSSIQGNGYTNKMTITFNYERNVNEVKRQKNATEAAVKKIIKEVIKPGMTDVQKELALHDYVVKHADYNMEGLKKNPADLEDHSAYGVLVLGKGVCESYAKAMHLLLNEVGIECKYSTGNKVNQDGSIGGGHAWNMVKLDNEWYNLDATWDDPVSDRVGKSDKEVIVSPVIHTYFNVTDAVFNKDHKRGDFEQKNYPAANGTKYAYDKLDVDEFMNDGTKVPSVESREELIEKVKEAMKNRETELYVRLKGFKMNQQELMDELGKVLDGNIYKSYGVSPTDSSHAYCNFVLR